MTLSGRSPDQHIDDHSDLWAAEHDPNLSFRTGGRDLLAEHAMAAAGFEAPVDIFLAMAELLELGPTPNVVLGDVAGNPVTTALSMEAGPGSAGIFNVATPPAHRGHGYGAAATARAVAASSTQGATWSWLQSSSAGHGIYQRLGFRDVELWPCWVSADSWSLPPTRAPLLCDRHVLGGPCCEVCDPSCGDLPAHAIFASASGPRR